MNDWLDPHFHRRTSAPSSFQRLPHLVPLSALPPMPASRKGLRTGGQQWFHCIHTRCQGNGIDVSRPSDAECVLFFLIFSSTIDYGLAVGLEWMDRESKTHKQERKQSLPMENPSSGQHPIYLWNLFIDFVLTLTLSPSPPSDFKSKLAHYPSD